MPAPPQPETALYAAAKAFLQGRGFVVKGEVCGCDAVGLRPAPEAGGRPGVAVCELKLGFNLELVLQGVDRMAAADEVWLAVAATRRGRDRDTRVHKLCRLLGFGLLAVEPRRGRVEVLVEPAPYRPRPSPKRRAGLLREHARRQGDPNAGGSTRAPIMTAYRQQALACAEGLRGGPCRPRDLRDAAPEAGRILLRNVYGWFERVSPGLYRITAAGEDALRRWGPGLAAAAEDP
ncbi:DUF2161 domain-containing phosphodiesterase [Roseomonas sp. BN140053]|uniref:DUF2161 domain-containing phosphodiesterase n=1 Tax=Roseomonas sp. BN140053 TaxID=3391898 RepID=UPI0039E84AD0